MKIFTSVVIGVAMLVSSLAFAQEDKNIGEAKAAAGYWLELTDAGNYAESWNRAAGLFQGAVTKTAWDEAVKPVRAPLGAVKARTLKSAVFTKSLPGAPDGEYVVVQYDTRFEHKASVVETVVPMREKSGEWKVSGYFIR